MYFSKSQITVNQAAIWCIFVLFLAGITNTVQAQYHLNKNARIIDSSCIQLTDDLTAEAGSIWYSKKISLNNDFDLQSMLFFGCNDFGADGMVFGLQDEDTSAGGVGGGMGFYGIKPSLGVEFDTYQNPGDPWFDHIAVIKDGDILHTTANTLAGPVSAAPDSADIEDCRQHRVRFIWNHSNHLLSVYFDCKLRLTYQGDIVNDIFHGDPEVYWGFTGATGGRSNVQQVCVLHTSLVHVLTDKTICKGGKITLSANGGTQYSWSPKKGLSDPSVSNPVASPATTTTYVVNITNECGDAWKDSLTVFVNNTVSVSLGNDTTVCDGVPVQLHAKSTQHTYLWPDHSTDSMFIAKTPGSYWVQVSNGTCSSTDTIRVKWATQKKGSDIIDKCTGLPAVLDPGKGFKSYVWIDSTKAQTLAVSVPGAYWVRLTTDICTFYDSFEVREHNLPVIDLGRDTSVCLHGTYVLNGGNNVIKFLWQDGSAQQLYNVTKPGKYWVKGTDKYGCASTDTVRVKYTDPRFSLGNDTSICPDDSLKLAIGNGANSFLWQDGSTAFTFMVRKAGIYYLTATKNGCPFTDSIIVSTYTMHPQYTLIYKCEGSDTMLWADNACKSYMWPDNTLNQYFKVQKPGTYVVKVAKTCPYQDTFEVRDHNLPIVNLGKDTAMCLFDTYMLDAGSDAVQYQWQDGSHNQAFLAKSPGKYWVTNTNTFGCKASDTLMIRPGEVMHVFVPNSFTPNGDGINEAFHISGLENARFQLQIYNRWGECVFKSEEVNHEWDGIFKGKAIIEGVYFYRLNVTDCAFVYHYLYGNITVLK